MGLKLTFDPHPKHNWRYRFHLQTPTGRIGDPNGLCQLGDEYHIFHQYTPEWPATKHGWGQWVTRDFVSWEFRGNVIRPEDPCDKNGVYSGSAVVRDGEMWCYYTGNVLHEGDYDYDYAGREANETLLVSPDGRDFSGEKVVVVNNADYPTYCSNHVRDPKVWEQDGTWYMLLGCRTMDDRGSVLLYSSPDGRSWKLAGSCTNTGEHAFGYMWECPNVADFGDKHFLLVCPQGAPKRPYSLQNLHNSGYFPIDTSVVELMEGDRGLMDADGPYPCIDETTFVEFDYGFDFYAPQSFTDNRGRQILVGWVGIPDIEMQYDVPTDNWLHTLAWPRELFVNEAGRLCQKPIEECEALVGDEVELTGDVAGYTGTVGSSSYDVFDLAGAVGTTFEDGTCDLELSGISGEGRVLLNDDFEILFARDIVEFSFQSWAGRYRTVRRLPLSALSAGRVTDMRIFVDTSIIEIFINGGEATFTTRWFPESVTDLRVTTTVPTDSTRAFKMHPYVFDIRG